MAGQTGGFFPVVLPVFQVKISKTIVLSYHIFNFPSTLIRKAFIFRSQWGFLNIRYKIDEAYFLSEDNLFNDKAGVEDFYIF